MIVKVCGMCQADNIRAVERAGADWMGFIFHSRSPRHVDALPAYLPTRCKRVGVFVNADISFVLHKVKAYGLHLVQLHGAETSEYCRRLQCCLPPDVGIIKMIPILTEADLRHTETYIGHVDYFLFETKQRQTAGHYGGSGQKFDWSILDAYTDSTPFLLTGGISPDDISQLRAFRHPQLFGIDINSRFETVPGIKDAALVQRFIAELSEKPEGGEGMI